MKSKPELRTLLELCGLNSTEAELLAQHLIEDLEWIRLEQFNSFCQPYYPDVADEADPFLKAEYTFGSTEFDVNNGKSSNDRRSTSIGGTGLNRGDLSHFAKMGKVARAMIPGIWGHSHPQAEKLRKALSSPANHLAALNEIWWLSRFPTATEISPAFSICQSTNVDWRFRLDGTDCWVNLEVKYRPSDSARLAHHEKPSSKSLLRDVLKKFNPSPANEINVVALTLFESSNRSLQDTLSKWLKQQSQPARIDAILTRSFSGASGADFDCQRLGAKTNILQCGAVHTPDEEDRCFVGRIEHVLDRKHWPEALLRAFPQSAEIQ